MKKLIIGNLHQTEIPGLGKYTSFEDLSQKRITKAVRQNLRKEFGNESVTVSCTASFVNGLWRGTCIINGQEYNSP
ncbi:MAG: hypothetical protein ACOC5G_03765 [Acidobacteriota bacterium]